MGLAKVNDLKSRVGDLERRLKVANNELGLAIEEYLQEKHKVKPGDRIFHKRRGCDIEYEFTRFRNSLTCCWAYGRKIKKDGAAGAQEICLYTDWRKA